MIIFLLIPEQRTPEEMDQFFAAPRTFVLQASNFPFIYRCKNSLNK
jgi:hypothetical protein